jgi:hypothetical protein
MGGGAAALTVTGTEYKFETSGTASPGATNITFKNGGKEVHHVQLLHIAQGKTMQDVAAALQAGDLTKVPGKFEGGVGQVAPGGEGVLEANLSPGTYAMLCFVPAADGAPHFVKGMAGSFEVAGDPKDAARKDADVKVTGRDYAFEAPDKMPAGDVHIQLTNGGQDFHEANIFKLATGVTTEQALQAIAAAEGGGPAPAGPPPITPMGGPQGVLPGESTRVVAKLDRGNYILICFIPDAQGTPHFVKGMVKPFAVD